MPYHIEVLSDVPAVIVSFGESFSAAREMGEMLTELRGLIESHSEPVTLINDLRFARLSMEDVVQSANLARHRETSMFHHPNVREILAVSESKLIQLSAKGLSHDIFGGLKLPVFDTLEGAIEYARASRG